MPKINSRTRAFASPGKYIQGPGVLDNLERYTRVYGNRVSIIIDGFLYENIKTQLNGKYTENTRIKYLKFGGECSMGEINRVKADSEDISSQVIVGIGGGKTLDTAKAVAHMLLVPVIIVPTAASTDAPCSAFSVLYTDEGVQKDCLYYKRNPEMVLVDTNIILKAPVRLLVSGMGDALSTYFESEANHASDTANYVGEGYRRTKLGLVLSKHCYETLLAKGVHAKNALENGCCTEALEDIIEANILLSGLGFENTGCAGAHGIHNGLTALPETNKYFHGEKVAFGTICQLILENQPSILIEEVFEFCISVGLPVTLSDIGVEETNEKIRIIAKHSLKDMLAEPFIVTENMLFNAIKAANGLGKMYKRG